MKTLLALAGTAFLTQGAQAAATAYADGDLFLGFRATSGVGNTNTYLINLGSAAFFRDSLAGVYNLSLGNIDADLDATFPLWDTRADVRWGVFGGYSVDDGLGNANVLFGTKAETVIGTVTTAWTRRNNTGQATTMGKVQNLATSYLGNTTTANSSVGLVQNTTDANDWSEFQPGGSQSSASTSFSVYSPSIEGTFAAGAAGTRLDLFSMTPAASGAGTYEGTFSISSGGQVTYTVVPEPTAFAMIGLGAGLLGFIRRRRALAA